MLKFESMFSEDAFEIKKEDQKPRGAPQLKGESLFSDKAPEN